MILTSNNTSELNLDDDAENTQNYASIQSEALVSYEDPHNLFSSHLSSLITEFGHKSGLIYYTNPKIYQDETIVADGLILNDTQFLQYRLTSQGDGKNLAAQFDIDAGKIAHVKALQFIYTTDLSWEKLIEISLKYQRMDVMLFIVGLSWPLQSEQFISLPQDNQIEFPENIRIIRHNLFADLVGLEDNYKMQYNLIIHYCQSNNIKALKQILHSLNNPLYTNINLKDALKRKGLIKNKIQEFFTSGDNKPDVREIIITVKCPTCQMTKKIGFPINLINKSKPLNTISIPAQLVCDHHFQAFVDQNLKVRGYQKVDVVLE
ncbi:hypothetical protein NEF87_001387 [Candidatus Lokiarchaeum ossiferum]|uniref:Uncharacterized protein n=1 Tax=Candidatus Lokiarchaeum ossiferum TaxID=2951803 RepID=A0ABY6HQD6_9ARCH|nr:hypothetical protein NEF87_001387 [Candidatus Lokiarchaeum sp. B-35]